MAGCFPRRETRQCCGQMVRGLLIGLGRSQLLDDRRGGRASLPEACAADEEHRELAGVPEEVMFATKPQP